MDAPDANVCAPISAATASHLAALLPLLPPGITLKQKPAPVAATPLSAPSPSANSTPTAAQRAPPKDTEPIVIPEKLCTCQQKCTERVTAELIKRVCVYFKSIPERNQQYKYLASLIQFKSKHCVAVDVKTTNTGRRFRQTGFRYYVPILSEEDLKRQAQQREELKMKMAAHMGERMIDPNFKVNPWLGVDPRYFEKEIVVDPNWDHVEVCLRAFVTIHLMSEKRVIITRQTRRLQKSVKCSKPLPSHANLVVEQEIRKRYNWDEDEAVEAEDEKECDIEDVLRDVREWMAEQASQAQKFSYPVNPKTLLPVGLVLPSSVTCMPVFPKGTPPKPYLPQDQDRDVDIVSNFFSHQLWKPEYIGGVP